ncbi:DUF6916 family protein [Oceanicaulis sp.]|uniref:DUF6916 family protein n=1 Tax=Oceanicaulis sp. TaxID=1924941 RepID=UPI003F71671E
MTTIEKLTADVFKPLVGETFDMEGRSLTLKTVTEGKAPTPSLPAPFTLEFSGPEDFHPMSAYALSHDAIGSHDLLIHRVGPSDEPLFEIIFG